ncbi:MAG: cobalt-precorrin-5B (C(1))-methyltransferase, partial [Verrucomicrobia bacterium]|nr:cobalt-precorrin-5B (C(1))-methyltransferase [Verrucomicrobiota bacterium]
AVPREMIRRAVSEVLDGDSEDAGLDIEIGCEDGERIAQRTFNPRLGIVGGISILGTTGVVEPKSMASFMASIEVYIRVALGDLPNQIVLSPGNLGQRFARASLELPLKQIVQMSNFVGFALDCVSKTLKDSNSTLPRLWIVGHPGKLAKVLDGVWDTHSHRGTGAVPALLSVARTQYPGVATALMDANSCETAIERLAGNPEAPAFWRRAEELIARAVHEKVRRVDEVRARLFAMDGQALGGTQ